MSQCTAEDGPHGGSWRLQEGVHGAEDGPLGRLGGCKKGVLEPQDELLSFDPASYAFTKTV